MATKANLKISTIDDHTYDQSTDILYDPLRTMILHPEAARQHALNSPTAAQKSLMHDRYQPFSQGEAAKLKKNIYIPVQTELIPTNHMNVVQKSNFRVIDAQERVLGVPIRMEEVYDHIQRKKDTRVVYELGQQIDIESIKSGSGLLKYNRSNPNLKSQIIGNEVTLSQDGTMRHGLSKATSESRLPTYEEVQKLLTYKDKEKIRKLKESQVNPEAKGYLYEYNLTSEGTEVKAKLKRQNSLSSLKGSTIVEAIPIPGNPTPSSPKELRMQLQQQSPRQKAPLVREYQGAVPVPMVMQSQQVQSTQHQPQQVQQIQQSQQIHIAQQPTNKIASVNQDFVNQSPLSTSHYVVNEVYATPAKLINQEYEQKDLATTAYKESPVRDDYKYNVQTKPQENKTGCSLFACGEDDRANQNYR